MSPKISGKQLSSAYIQERTFQQHFLSKSVCCLSSNISYSCLVNDKNKNRVTVAVRWQNWERVDERTNNLFVSDLNAQMNFTLCFLTS